MSSRALRSIKPSSPIPVTIAAPVVGWVCGYDEERGLLIDHRQNPSKVAVAARFTMPLDRATVQQAVATQQAALLYFEDGNPELPIVVGLLQPLTLAAAASAKLQLPPSSAQRELVVDGKKLSLQAADEIDLRCGPARLLLRRNGLIELKGVRVVSQASGTNRIRGGSVQIN